MGRRKDQIFVNAIAKQYAYVTEEIEVSVSTSDDGAKEQPIMATEEESQSEVVDEFGARYKMKR